MKSYAVLFIIFILLFQKTSASTRDSSTIWKTLKTEHFEIIYNSKFPSVAHDYAQYAEAAYELLIPIFKEAPETTIVVIDDSTDVANGWTRVSPYPLITIFPVLPVKNPSLRDYHTWGLSLFIHEYTHVLNLYPRHGFYTPLKYIFGSLFYPNQFLPLWYQEGIAVHMETQLTDFGRLRSPYYNSIIRALVKDDLFSKDSIDRANASDIPSFPHGSRPYFYGSLVWNKIAQLDVTEPEYYLNQRYARRIPYLINAPITDLTQTDFETLYNDYKRNLDTLARKQIKKINANSDTKKFFHPQSGRVYPLSPNEEYLIYNYSELYKSSNLRLVKKNDFDEFKANEFKTLPDINQAQNITWFKDSNSFIYEKIDTYKRYYNYKDLYLYNIKDKSNQRLTSGARAQDPTISPDQTSVAFIQNHSQGHKLVKIKVPDNKKSIKKINPSEITVIYEALGNSLSHPKYIHNNKIALIERKAYGKQGISIININSRKKEKEILLKYSPITSLAKTKYGFIFGSTVTGTSNLYYCNDDFKSVRAITNTDTYTYNGSIDHNTNTLFFDQMTSKGFKTFKKKIFLKKRTPAAPKIKPLIYVEKKHAPFNELQEIKTQDGGYSSTSYLLPRYIFPYIYSNGNNLVYRVSTSATDPLNKQFYAVALEFDNGTQKENFEFSYANRHLPVDLGFTTASNYSILANSSNLVKSSIAQGYISSFIPGLSNKWSSSLSLGGNTHTLVSNEITESGATLSFGYSNLSSSSGFLKKGKSFFIKQSYYSPTSGYADYYRTHANGVYITDKFLPPNHSLLSIGNLIYAPNVEINESIFLLGSKTLNGNYFAKNISSSVLVRGYPLSSFIGRNMGVINLEYQFPLNHIYKGNGTLPFFSKRLKGAITLDSLLLDGVYVNYDTAKYSYVKNKSFSSIGAEIKLDTQVGYHFPLTFLLGVHYGFNKSAGGQSPYFTLGFTIPTFL